MTGIKGPIGPGPNQVGRSGPFPDGARGSAGHKGAVGYCSGLIPFGK